MRIEQIAAGTATEQRTWMIALYAVVDGKLPPEDRRPDADDFLAKHASLLAPPSMVSFVVALATGASKWSIDDHERVVVLQRAQRGRKGGWEVPAVLDAALLAVLADQLDQVGRHEEALAAVDEAIGELPGNVELMRIEQALMRREPPELNLLGVLAPDAELDQLGADAEGPQYVGPSDRAGRRRADALEAAAENT